MESAGTGTWHYTSLWKQQLYTCKEPTFMRMKMTRVRKTLARGGLQACEVPGGSNSSTRPWRTHVRLSNRVTSVSFCESYR